MIWNVLLKIFAYVFFILLGNFHLVFSFSLIILNLLFRDSSLLLESLTVEENYSVDWWYCRRITFAFLFAWGEELIEEEFGSSQLAETFCFLYFFFLFTNLHWVLCPISLRIFFLIPVSFYTNRNRTFLSVVIASIILYLIRSIHRIICHD